MSGSTRRGFVKNSVAAAAGMTVIGALASESADAKASSDTGAVIAYVRNARTGEISLMSGEHARQIHDRELAARLARAAR